MRAILVPYMWIAFVFIIVHISKKSTYTANVYQ